MKQTRILLLVVLSCLVASAVAQTPLVAGEAASQSQQLGVPSACSPCLWYSGDPDRTNPLSSQFINANETYAGGNSIAVFVPFVPAPNGTDAKQVGITSITFTEAVSADSDSPVADLDGGTYTFREGVSAGNGGKVLETGACHSLNAVDTGVLWSAGTMELFNFTCVLERPVEVSIGTIYWNVADIPATNRMGWSDDYYNSFFNGTLAAGTTYNFVPTASIPITGLPLGTFAQFAVAIAGNYRWGPGFKAQTFNHARHKSLQTS